MLILFVADPLIKVSPPLSHAWRAVFFPRLLTIVSIRDAD